MWDELKVHRVHDEILITTDPDGNKVEIDVTDGNSSVGLTVAKARTIIYIN